MSNGKRLVFTALAIICAVFLVSCSDNRTESSKPQSSQTEDSAIRTDLTKMDITLTVWESGSGIDEWIRLAGSKFTEMYPNISIEYCDVEPDDVIDELEDADSVIPSPDLFAATSDMLGELVEKEYVIPTKNAEVVSANTLTTASNPLFINGTMYGYPTSCETYALYYNKKLISKEDIPKTWDEIISYSEAFSQLYTGKYAFLFHRESMYYVQMLLSENGNRILFDEENTGLTSQSAVDGIQLLQRMKSIFPENVQEFTGEDYDNLFLNGDVAMFVNGSWFAAEAKKAGLSFGVTVLPSFTEDGTPSLSLTDVRGMFVSGGSQHPKEASAFAEFLTSEEMQQLRLKLTSALPSVNIMVDDEYANGFIDQMSYSYPVSGSPFMGSFWDYGEEFCKEVYSSDDLYSELARYEEYLLSIRTDNSVPAESTKIEETTSPEDDESGEAAVTEAEESDSADKNEEASPSETDSGDQQQQ